MAYAIIVVLRNMIATSTKQKNKKLIVLVSAAGIGGIAVWLALMTAGSGLSFSLPGTPEENLVIGPTNAQQPPETEAAIREFMKNNPDKINDIAWRQAAIDMISTQNTGDTAKLIINTEDSWTAAVRSSNSVTESVSGSGMQSIDFECKGGSMFSHVVQSSDKYAGMMVYVAQDGHILKQGQTASSYGLVALAGACSY
jgi:hypothetical protein